MEAYQSSDEYKTQIHWSLIFCLNLKVLMIATGVLLHMFCSQRKIVLMRLQLKQYCVNEQWATKRSHLARRRVYPMGCACRSLDRLVLSHKQFWAMIHHQHCVCEQRLTRGKQLVCFAKGSPS